MNQKLNLGCTLTCPHDVHNQPAIISTDGRRVRLLFHQCEGFQSGWYYTDLASAAADELAAALTARYKPRPVPRLHRWFTSLRGRR